MIILLLSDRSLANMCRVTQDTLETGTWRNRGREERGCNMKNERPLPVEYNALHRRISLRRGPRADVRRGRKYTRLDSRDRTPYVEQMFQFLFEGNFILATGEIPVNPRRTQMFHKLKTILYCVPLITPSPSFTLQHSYNCFWVKNKFK